MSTRRLGSVIVAVMLCVAFFLTLTGCVGYVGPDDDGGGAVYVTPPAPDVVIFGGDYDRPHDVHAYSHRGFESRADARHGGHGDGGHRR
ncbi:MAG: hypothetical protein ACREE6_04975 [Limisphaerales bacterium]